MTDPLHHDYGLGQGPRFPAKTNTDVIRTAELLCPHRGGCAAALYGVFGVVPLRPANPGHF